MEIADLREEKDRPASSCKIGTTIESVSEFNKTVEVVEAVMMVGVDAKNGEIGVSSVVGSADDEDICSGRG